MEIGKDTTTMHGVRDLKVFEIGDPVYAFVNGAPHYCRIAEKYNEETKTIKVQFGGVILGDVAVNAICELHIDERHLQKMGFVFNIDFEVGYFSWLKEPSLKFVPNFNDAIDLLNRRLILVQDLQKFKLDIADSSEDMVEAKGYMTLGSLHLFERLYKFSNYYGEINYKVDALLEYMNSLN